MRVAWLAMRAMLVHALQNIWELSEIHVDTLLIRDMTESGTELLLMRLGANDGARNKEQRNVEAFQTTGKKLRAYLKE